MPGFGRVRSQTLTVDRTTQSGQHPEMRSSSHPAGQGARCITSFSRYRDAGAHGRRGRHGNAWAALLLVLVLPACGSSNDAIVARPAVVRDSVGVQIVENRDPLWTADTRWTIDSLPTLTIGVEEGDPQFEFFRLADVRRLTDGRIAALNVGTSELRYFSAAGDYVCTSGREGAGPGEFEQASWMQLLDDDSLLVYSSGGGARLSLIGPDGKFVRTLSIPRVPDVQYVQPNGILSNGSMLLRSGRSYGMGVTSGTHRDSAILFIFDGATERARIGPLPSNESAVVASENRMSVTSLVFGKSLVTGFGTGLFYVGTNERYEISAYDTLGRLARSIRLERAPEPVTSSAIAYVESTRLANAENESRRATTKALFEQMQFPPAMPFYGDMLVDPRGNLWAARYAYLPGPITWDVFDSGGQLLGEVQLPDGFRLRMIGDGEIVGISRDDLEVQRVEVYRILKPGEPASAPSSARRSGLRPEDAAPSEYRTCGAT